MLRMIGKKIFAILFAQIVFTCTRAFVLGYMFFRGSLANILNHLYRGALLNPKLNTNRRTFLFLLLQSGKEMRNGKNP